MENKEENTSFREPTPYKVKSFVRESIGSRLGTIVEDSVSEDIFVKPLPKVVESSALNNISRSNVADCQKNVLEETTPPSSPLHGNKIITPPAVLKERIKVAERNYDKLKRDYLELSEFTTYEAQMLKADKGYYEKCAENENLQSQVNELNNKIIIQEELINSLENQLKNSKSDYDLLQNENKKIHKEFSVIETKLIDEGIKWEIAETKWKNREDELKKSLEEAWSCLKIKDDRLNLLKDKIRELNERESNKLKGPFFQDTDKISKQEEQHGDISILCSELSVIFDSETNTKTIEIHEIESRKYIENASEDIQQRLKEQDKIIKELQLKLASLQSCFANDLQDVACQTDDNLLQNQYLNNDLLDCTKLIDFDVTIPRNDQPELISKSHCGDIVAAQDLLHIQAVEKCNENYKNENELLHKEIAHYKCVIDDKDKIITRLENEFKQLSLNENKEQIQVDNLNNVEYFTSLNDFKIILTNFNNHIDKMSIDFMDKFNEKCNKLIGLELKVKNLFNNIQSVISKDVEISLNNIKELILKMNTEIENSGSHLNDKLTVKMKKLEILDSLLLEIWNKHQEKHLIKPINDENLNPPTDRTVYFSSNSKPDDMDFTLLPSSNQTITEDIIPEADLVPFTGAVDNLPSCKEFISDVQQLHKNLIDQSIQVDIITLDNIEDLKNKINEQNSVIDAKECETVNLLKEIQNYKEDNFKLFKEKIYNITNKLNTFESDLENSLLNKEKTVNKLEENLNSIKDTLKDRVILSSDDLQKMKADNFQEQCNSFDFMKTKMEYFLNNFNALEEHFSTRISHEVNRLDKLKDFLCIIGDRMKREHVTDEVINESIASSVPKRISACESADDTVTSLEISNIPSSLSLGSMSPNTSDTLDLESTALNKELMEAGFFNKKQIVKQCTIIEDSDQSVLDEENLICKFPINENGIVNQSLDYTCASIKDASQEISFACIKKLLCDKMSDFVEEIDKRSNEFNNKINKKLNVLEKTESRIYELYGKLLKTSANNTCEQISNTPAEPTTNHSEIITNSKNEECQTEMGFVLSKLEDLNPISKLENGFELLEKKLEEKDIEIQNKNEEIKHLTKELEIFKGNECNEILTKVEEMFIELSTIESRLTSNLDMKLKSVEKLEELVATKLEEKHVITSLNSNILELEGKLFEKDEIIKNNREELNSFMENHRDNFINKIENMFSEVKDSEERLNTDLKCKLETLVRLEDQVLAVKSKLEEQETVLQLKDEEIKNVSQKFDSFKQQECENVLSKVEAMFNEMSNLESRLNNDLESKLQSILKLEEIVASKFEEKNQISSLHNEIQNLKEKLEEKDSVIFAKDEEIKKASLDSDSSAQQLCENMLSKVEGMCSEISNLESRVNGDLDSKFQSIIKLEEILTSKREEMNQISSLNNEIQILKEKLEEQDSVILAKDEEIKKASQEIESFKQKDCENMLSKVEGMFSEMSNLESRVNSDLESKLQSIVKLEEMVTSMREEGNQISSLNNEIQILKEKLEEQDSVILAKDEEINKAFLELESFKQKECENILSKVEEMVSEMSNLEQRLNSDLESKFQSIAKLEELVLSKFEGNLNDVRILKEKLENQCSLIKAKDEIILKTSQDLEYFKREQCENVLSKVHEMFTEMSNLECRFNNSLESKLQSLKNLEDLVALKLGEKSNESSLKEEIEILKEMLQDQYLSVQTKDDELKKALKDLDNYKQIELAEVKRLLSEMTNFEIRVNNDLQSNQNMLVKIEEQVSTLLKNSNKSNSVESSEIKSTETLPGATAAPLVCMTRYFENPSEETLAFDNTEVCLDEGSSFVCEDSNETNIFMEKSVFIKDLGQQTYATIEVDPFRESIMENPTIDVDPFRESIMETTLIDNEDSDSSSDFGTPLAQHLEENNLNFSHLTASRSRLFSENFTEDSLLNFASKIRDILTTLIDNNELNHESFQYSNAQTFLQNICQEKVSEENQKLLKEIENTRAKIDKCEQVEITLEEFEKKLAEFIEVAYPSIEESTDTDINTKLLTQFDEVMIRTKSLTETLQQHISTSENGFLNLVEILCIKHGKLNDVNELLNQVTLEHDKLKQELASCKVLNDQLSDTESFLQALANDFIVLREAYNKSDYTTIIDLISSLKTLVSPTENLPENLEFSDATNMLQQILEDFKYISNLLKEYSTSNSGLRNTIENLCCINLKLNKLNENCVKPNNIEPLLHQVTNMKFNIADLSNFGTAFKLEVTKILNTLQNELRKLLEKNKDQNLEMIEMKKELIENNAQLQKENEMLQQNNDLLSKDFNEITTIINKLKNDVKEKDDKISELISDKSFADKYNETLQSFNKLQTEHEYLLTNIKDIQFNKMSEITKLLNINIEQSENDVNSLLSNLCSLNDILCNTVLQKNDLELKYNELKLSHDDVLSYIQNLKSEQQEFKLKEDERFNNLQTQYEQLQNEFDKIHNKSKEQNDLLNELSKYKNTIIEINKLFNIEDNNLDSNLSELQSDITNVVNQRNNLSLQYDELKISYDKLLSDIECHKNEKLENEKTAEQYNVLLKEMENLRIKYNDHYKSFGDLTNIKTLITDIIKLFNSNNYSTEDDLSSLTNTLQKLVIELISEKLQLQENYDSDIKYVSNIKEIIVKICKLFNNDFVETCNDFIQLNKNCNKVYNFTYDLIKSNEELKQKNVELFNFQNEFLKQIKDLMMNGYKLFNEDFNFTEVNIDNFVPYLKKLFDLMDETITSKKEQSETKQSMLEERLLEIKHGIVDILSMFNEKVKENENDETVCLNLLKSHIVELFKDRSVLKRDWEVYSSEIECLKKFVGCGDNSTELSVWDNIKSSINLIKERTNETKHDPNELLEKVKKLESDLLDADGVKRQLAIELHGMDPKQSVYDLMKMPSKDLYVTFMKTLMKKEELLINDIQNDYETKLIDLNEKINQLREEEKRKLDWISQLEQEIEKLADEGKNQVKCVENLTADVESKVEVTVVENLKKETILSECVKCKDLESNEQKVKADFVEYVEQLKEKQSEIQHLKNVIKEKTDFIYKLEETQSEKETKIIELLTVINKKQELIEELQEKVNELFSKISSIDKLLTEFKTVNEELKRNIVDKNNNIEKLEKQISILKSQTGVIDRYENEISEINNQLSVVKTKLNEQKVKYDETITEKLKCINNLQSELETYKTKYLEMEENLNSLNLMKKDLDEKQVLIDELQEKINALSSKNIMLEQNLSTEVKSNEKLHKEYDEIKKEFDEHKKKYNAITSEHLDSNCPHLQALEVAKNEIIELNRKNKEQFDNFLLVKNNLEEDIQYKLNMISELDVKLKTAIQNHKQAMMSKAEFCEKLERSLHEHKEKERRFDQKINIQRDMYMKEKKIIESELNKKIEIIDELKESINKIEIENDLKIKDMENKLKDQFESFSNEIQSKNKLIDDLKEKLHIIETHNKEKLLLKREISNKETIINELKSKLEKSEQEIEKSYIELTSLKKKVLDLCDGKTENIEDALKQIKTKLNETNQLIEQIEQLKIDNKNLDGECDFLSSNIEHLEKQVGITYKWKEEEVAKVEAQLIEEKKKLEEISAAKCQLENDLLEARNKILNYESEVKLKEKSILDLQNQITDLYSKCTALETKASQLLKSQEDFKKEKLLLTEEINNKNWKIGSLEIRLQEESKSLQQKQELLDDYKSKITKINDESVKLRETLNKIESNKQKSSSFAESKENANLSVSPSGRKLGEIRNVQIRQLEERIEKLEKDRKIFKTLSVHRAKKILELEKALNIKSAGMAHPTSPYGSP